jgi:hypothetical protein
MDRELATLLAMAVLKEDFREPRKKSVLQTMWRRFIKCLPGV